MDVLNLSANGASYLPQLLEKAVALNAIVSERMGDFKSAATITAKVSQMAEVLKSAQNLPCKNESSSFFANLTEVSNTLD